MTVQDFLKMLIGPEFTYVHVLDPVRRDEFAEGFADDMIDNVMFSRQVEVLSFYFQHSCLIINGRRITKDE